MAPTTARDAATWMIWFANEHGETMTNLRLQKLLYYAQAWHLAIHNAPLFESDFQAWIHGPVISSLYGEYKRFGSSPIATADRAEGSETLPEPEIPQGVRNHLLEVMEAYGDLTAWQLERLSHQERPWLEARGGIAIDAPCKNVILRESMREFYKAALNAQAPNTDTR